MASAQMVWGLDVGKCALKAIKLRAAPDGNLELLAVDYIEHEQILSQPDADSEALIATALETFLSRNDITDTPVVVAVPGHHTLARFSKLPPVEAKKIAEIVRYEAEQQIPFDMDEVIWDYQTFQEEDTPDIEVGIFAMKRDLIRDYLLHYEHAGIEPAAVQSAPLAVYNCAHLDGMISDQTTVLLDIGAENTDLIVASAHGLWTRTIPLGGNSFTDTLVKAFKLSFGKAESLKRSAATSKYARQIFQTMRPVFADLVQELQRSLGFYTSTHRDAELSKVVGLGNAFKLPGLQKYLQQNLGMNVDRPEKFNKLVPAEGTKVSVLKEELLSFSVAYGLAVQGLKQSKIITNLLPPEIARGVVWRRKRPFLGAAAACLLLAAGAIWARQVIDIGELNKNLGDPPVIASAEDANRLINQGASGTPGDQARQILAAAQKLRQEYNAVSGQGSDELRNIEDILKLQQDRGLWNDLLKLIHDALPTPQPPLADADTTEAYRAAVEAGGDALKRSERRQIFIERFSSRFEPNLDDEAVFEGIVDLAGETDVEEFEGENRYGFKVELTCRTPHHGRVAFVTNEFKAKLRELGRVPERGFYINRIWLTRGEVLLSSAPGPGARPPATRAPRTRGRRGGRGGGTPRGPQQNTQAAQEIVDPVTDEVMNADWEFDVVFDIVLEDLPESAQEENADEGGGTGGDED
ncbi:MAG: type IV pilus assembly protein PilM [bacterium]|nr:type IV pilus assembly protein PilM [bacterium]